MDAEITGPERTGNVDEVLKEAKKPVSRRALLKLGLLGTGVAATTLAGIDALAWAPKRAIKAATAVSSFPAVQFDISNFSAAATTIDGVSVKFPPVYTVFLTARLKRTPLKTDQFVLNAALNDLESLFPFSPGGLFTFVSYGLPYFRRLPSSLVSALMPRLLSDHQRFALEEAVASPTDVTEGGGIKKQAFNVNVVIESNDVLFTFRSDRLSNIQNAISWFQGSNTLNGSLVTSPAFSSLFTFTSMRTMFIQTGLPHLIAQQNQLPYADCINPQSPMWMGFTDQQVTASGPAAITTFQGNRSARFTDATSSSYFANGTIQHLSHIIQDLVQFYGKGESYLQRVQYMFRSDPIPSRGNADQFANGGGPAFLPNDNSVFLRFKEQNTTEAVQTATSPNPVNDPQVVGNNATIKPRMGHLSALQQSSRAADGTPIHVRNDGPGFDTMDVPDGSNQPKLHFTIFVPTADFFQTMRVNQAALRFQTAKVGSGGSSTGTVAARDNGLERFLTATRRQNFLLPPRAYRSFPLLELSFGEHRK